jgi:1,2-diacylglycerol 3-beta-galactosyltransferase
MKGKNQQMKILILMSDTGGGHRASAQALDQAIQRQFPGRFAVEILDIWTDYAKYPFNQFVPLYRFMAKHPLIWRGFYAYGSFSLTKRFTEFLSWRSSYKNFEKAIQFSAPDFVISVHPLCQLMPVSIVQAMNQERFRVRKPPIPFVTVVTDLGSAHRCWFDPRVDACYVPSEAVQEIALYHGMPAEKIILKGLPIRPSFWKDLSASSPLHGKARVRRSLGLVEDSKTVMLMGGGDGVGGIASIAAEVSKKLQQLPFASQLVVICGNNQKVLQSLQRVVVEHARNHSEKVRFFVKGFVNNVDEFMAASDCLLTKAGPGTIAESMARGLPMILSSFLPGQVCHHHFLPPVLIQFFRRRRVMCRLWRRVALASIQGTNQRRSQTLSWICSQTTANCSI